jgi:hypothetical protein
LSGRGIRPGDSLDHQPETEHTVNIGKLKTWLDGGGKSPNEQLLKSRLREML